MFFVGRQYLRDREEVRWAMLNEKFHREKNLVQVKRRNYQRGNYSVGYDPITLTYSANKEGDLLKEEDVRAQVRLPLDEW